jgi:hypothetical protein
MEFIVETIRQDMNDILSERPTYGDTEIDVAHLRGKQAVAEDILEFIRKYVPNSSIS